MNPLGTDSSAGELRPHPNPNLEETIQNWGKRIFDAMEAAGSPPLFTRKGLYGALMEWAMRDEKFKTQLFRFVDVLPMLTSSADVTRHFKEYLGEESVSLSPAIRTAMNAATGVSWLFSSGVKSQITAMARQFMIGNDEREVVSALRQANDHDIAFTVDVLGETVVSQAEADQYAQRYLDLISLLHSEVAKWTRPCKSNQSFRGAVPALNFSVKVSALCSQFQPAAPETALEQISARLRPVLRKVKEIGGFINFDMESYAWKSLTLQLFKALFSESEFADGPACGLVLQTYLKDTQQDLGDVLDWARSRKRRITVRLVKGAYWDYETVIAQQQRWPIPVFSRKPETDANFESITTMLLENADTVDTVFGTHNVRSIAHALAQAQRLGLSHRDLEFQMLHGMADPIKAALLELDCRVREYCPVGELLPGMAYLVRRLLENTSNEGFLAKRFAKGVERAELLRNPSDLLSSISHVADVHPTTTSQTAPSSRLTNEPLTDFNIPPNRETFRNAIQQVRQALGERHPLIINNKSIGTREWSASLNPANQSEIVGYAAQATVVEAEAALKAACEAQHDWARTPAAERASMLEKTAGLIRRDKATLAALEMLEAGKCWTEADADVAEAIDFCNFYATEMRELGRPQRTQAVPGEENLQHWRARGVGIIISPWNFPLAILTGMTAAALVAGNSVILKPSDQTPIIASRLIHLLMEAGLPPGVANLLTGPGSVVGSHLVGHPSTDFVAFTGSKEVGLKIWETAGRTPPGQANLKKVICEMGGKNCVIVDSDADLDEAVAGCLGSAFGYQGQKCSALSRLVLLADIHDRFLERFVAAAASLPSGPAEVPGRVFGPVINRDAQTRILAIIQAGRSEARLVWQGQVSSDPKACYVPPTIFAEVPPGSRLFQEEIFGPVVAVTRAKDFTEALALANQSEFALTGGCYSRSPSHIQLVKDEFLCGNLYINRGITGALVGRQPFGGFKMSGGGTKAGGREYLQNFLIPRVITENCLRRGFAPTES